MKIAFIGQKGLPAHGGGVERYVEDLAVRLAAAGQETIVFTRPNYTAKSQVAYRGVRTVSLPSLGTKHLDAISHSFLSAVSAIRQRADIIHFQSIGPALVAWIPKLLSRRTRIVSTLQSRDYQHQKWGGVARMMLQLGEWCMCRFSDELIVLSSDMQQYVQDRYGVTANVVPNGANLEPIAPRQGVAAWNLRPGSYAVAISRLVPHKGIGYLIEAFRALPTDHKLVIVGEGSFTSDYVDSLNRLAADDERIIFTGNQSGQLLSDLYDNAAVFVQPSESEGLSLALLEAMSRSLPVLVSDISENLMAIGDTGLSFRNTDVADLREKLAYALAHPQEMLLKGEAARQRVAEHFNWDDLAPRIMALYEKTAVGPTGLAARGRQWLQRFSQIIPIF